MITRKLVGGCFLTVEEGAVVPEGDEWDEAWDDMAGPHKFMGVEVKRRQKTFGADYKFSGDGGGRPCTPLDVAPAWVRRCVAHAEHVAPKIGAGNFRADIVQVNWYDGGTAGISRHQDDEKFLAPGAPIFSYTALADASPPRTFRIATDKKGPPLLDLKPNNGDMIIMHGPDFQTKLWHEVPKTTALAAKMSRRINVTVRAKNDAL